MAAIVRAPSDKIPEIIKTLAEKSVMWTFMGWFVAVVLLIVSVVLFIVMRKYYLAEIRRVTDVRDELQAKLTDQEVQHSRFKGGQ
jgi:uncharacterized membrane protein